MKHQKCVSRIVAIICGIVLLAGCGSTESVQPPNPSPFIGAKGLGLQEIDEATLLAAFQDEARGQVEQMTACASSSPVPGNAPAMMDAADASGESSGVAATGTNLQEAGVDEADVIKVHGDTAYVLRADGVHVVRVWPAAKFGELARVALKGKPIGLFVTDTHLVAITNTSWGDDGAGGSYPAEFDGVQVSVIDITTPSAPRLLRQELVSGRYVSSRRVDDRVRLVMNNAMQSIPYPYQLLTASKSCESNMAAIRTQMESGIEQRTLADWLPPVLNAGRSRQRTVHDLGRVYASGARGSSVLSLVQFAIDADGAQDSAVTVLGTASTVYASTNAVYAAQNVYLQDDDVVTSAQTAIHMFAFERGAPQYRGTGAVPGRLINQFAMSEHRDVLRVATTTSGATSGVYTLDITDDDLPILGKVEGLAKGESIYAVRFAGDTGYVVTFKKIDPLFVIDLVDPRAPQLAGELKVPGFSTYLHPLEDGRLIGLGKDADDQGSFAWFEGLKLSLFDVSAPTAPAEVSHTIIGTRGSDSPALTDHHAFTYDAGRGLLALPVTVFDGEVNASQCGTFAYRGVHLYRVNESGFTLDGVIRDDPPSTAKCWGASAGRSIARTVIIGDAQSSGVLMLTDKRLRMHALESLARTGEVVW